MRHFDTNIVVAWGRRRDARMVERFEAIDPRAFAISFVVEAELRVGILKDPTYAAARRVSVFIESSRVIQSSPAVVAAYAEARASLEGIGMRISDNDLWVAAVALVENAVLVTLNVREFARVPDLKVEDWSV